MGFSQVSAFLFILVGVIARSGREQTIEKIGSPLSLRVYEVHPRKDYLTYRKRGPDGYRFFSFCQANVLTYGSPLFFLGLHGNIGKYFGSAKIFAACVSVLRYLVLGF